MTQQNSEILLDIKDLSIIAEHNGKEIPILKDINIRLHKGEVMGLIGESGAGKSTLALASMAYARGSLIFKSGSVFLNGQDILKHSKTELQKLRGTKVSYVAQSAVSSFNPAIKLYDQVCDVVIRSKLLSKQDAKDRAITLFKKVQLPNPETIGDRYPHQLSGGQLQRVMAVMAMMPNPDLIILDEPTTALDVTTQIEVLALLKDLITETNTAGLYVTHDLAVVMQICDTITVLRNGEIMEKGTPLQLLNESKHPYTKELIAAHSHTIASDNTNATAPTILSVQNITAAYGNAIDVLKDISIDIKQGETVSIVGESGSGKSTLARNIVGLLPQRKGDVLFHDEVLPIALEHRQKEQLRRIQMIYQMADTAINPRQKIGDVIGRPIDFYFNVSKAEKHDRIFDLLEQIDLPKDFANRYPGELSGGQKQRIGIARALAARPELIICDEITSALDLLVAQNILELLKKLQDKYKYTYMFITHDLETVRSISDSIVVMKNGAVIEQGTRNEILNPPFAPYTKTLLESAPQLDPTWLDTILQDRK